jgi:predicted ATPase
VVLKRVVIENYKSIAHCDVEIGPLTFLVGPNGSGKSNFLDALAFIGEVLQGMGIRGGRNTLDEALRKRGGFDTVLYGRTKNNVPALFSIQLQLEYQKRILNCGIHVQGKSWDFVDDGSLDFDHPAYKFITQLRSYDFIPGIFAQPKPPSQDPILQSSGENLVSIFHRLGSKAEITQAIISAIIPSITNIIRVEGVGRETLQFNQGSHVLLAESMSDGTLRTLALLTALFQPGLDGRGVSLICLEEPETGLHPNAINAIFDTIRNVSQSRQVIVTSHSPELLNNKTVALEHVWGVLFQDGQTKITQMDREYREIIQAGTLTAGDLLRSGHFLPNIEEFIQDKPLL